jgi:hypothetical protein
VDRLGNRPLAPQKWELHAANTGAQFRRQAHHRCSHRCRTPQYSADLDPIEMAFAKLKAFCARPPPDQFVASGTDLVP